MQVPPPQPRLLFILLKFLNRLHPLDRAPLFLATPAKSHRLSRACLVAPAQNVSPYIGRPDGREQDFRPDLWKSASRTEVQEYSFRPDPLEIGKQDGRPEIQLPSRPLGIGKQDGSSGRQLPSRPLEIGKQDGSSGRPKTKLPP